MFYRNEVGAWVGDMFTSIIHTCYLGKVNTMDYLIKLQKYELHMKSDPEKMDAMELSGNRRTN